MESTLLIAVLGGLAGMIGWGLADFFAKKTVDEIEPVASLVWAHVFGVSALTLAVLYKLVVLGQSVAIPREMREWWLLLFFGALQAVVYLLVYTGFSKGRLAVLNPVFASYSGLTAALSILVFGELLSSYVLIALALIYGGILMLNLDVAALKLRQFRLNSPGFKEVAIASLLAAFWTLFWDRFIGGKDWLSYALIMYAFMTLAAYAISRIQRVSLDGIKSHLWKFLLFIGLGEIVAYAGISWGFSATSFTSVVALLSGSFSLPTIFLAYLFLKERLTVIQILGAFTILGGIALVSIT